MVTDAAAPHRSARVPRVRGAVAVAVVVAGAVVLLGGPAVRSWAVGIGAVASPVAIAIGIRRNRPDRPRPWWCLFAAAVAFALSLILRVGFPVGSYVASMAGYAATTVCIVSWIRDRRATDDSAPLIDAILIVLSSAYVAWILLLSPKLDSIDSGGSATTVPDAVAASLYPVLDSGLLTLTVYLLYSTGRSNRSLQWVTTTFVATLAGDALAGIVANADVAIPVAVPEALYFIAFLTLAIAALDPSMRSISRPVGANPPRGSQRYFLVFVLLCVCAVGSVLGSVGNTVDIVVRSVLLISILGGTLLRGERALVRAQRSETRARYEATHDRLTSLPNRSALGRQFESLSGSVQPAADLSLLFVDLDDFKIVNDSYGHRVGDELIAAVASRVRDHLCADDSVVRYAGDEFIVLTARARHQAETLARDLIELVARPFELTAATVYVTATVGIAGTTLGADATGLDDLVREADAAMYHAKSQGSSRYAFFDESLRARSRSTMDTATALRGALDRGEFSVHYQPIVSIGSRRIVVFEALLRWNHRGVTKGPADFIPIAESLDLIGRIGEWVLDTALADLVTLRCGGLPRVTMSVNVSALQLRHLDLPERVAALLDKHGLAGADLALEVTETTLIEDPPAAEVVLERLAEMGVLIVLDDFGTGYSSLSRLRQLPIALLKIDRSFVADVDWSESAKSLVSAIVAMADALPIRTVAEGVETEEQASVIESLNVGFGQGYLFGRPAPLASWTDRPRP